MFPAALSLGALNGSNGFRIDGAQVHGSLGSSAVAAGDLNGDGVDDLVVGVELAGFSGALSGSAFKNLSAGAADADDRILYKQATGELFYDADGSAKGGAILFAVLDNHAALTAADILVV